MTTNRQKPSSDEEGRHTRGPAGKSSQTIKEAVFRRRWEPEFSLDWNQFGKQKST